MKQLIIFYLLLPILGWSQFAKLEIIAANGIKSVELWKHRVDPLIDGEKTVRKLAEAAEIKRETPKKEHLSTWFFKENGMPDSCWVFEREEKLKKTYIYQFDSLNRLVELQENRNNKFVSKTKVETQDNGDLQYLNWNTSLNDWEVTYTLAADSLFIRSKNVSDSTGYYFDDRATGIIGRARFDDGKVVHRYQERWVTNKDGRPDSVHIKFDQFDDTTKRKFIGRSFDYSFKLDEDGNVISTYEMKFRNLNYYKRGNKKRPFDEKMPYDDVLRNFMGKNELIEESIVFTEARFSGVHPRHYLEYKYTKYSTDE